MLGQRVIYNWLKLEFPAETGLNSCICWQGYGILCIQVGYLVALITTGLISVNTFFSQIFGISGIHMDT